MSLLNRWYHLAEIGAAIRCPEMRLDARDWEEPIVKGSGEIRVTSPTTFTYTLDGMPEDVGHTLRCLTRQRDNPYDGLMRFRLNVIDEKSQKLCGGWTIPNVDPDGNDGLWRFTGETESIWADDPPADHVGTETLYLLPRNHRARPILGRFVTNGKTGADRLPEHRLALLGTDIVFRLNDAANTLSVAATASEQLPQTLTENWLGEPLRIMFGQLIFPRMVARANPTSTMISIRPAPRWHADSDWAALWGGPNALSDREGFWRTYAQLLTFVACARGKDGHPNFEAHKLTHLYEEVIQASRGSRWVWALTFASSIEGLIRMLVPRGTPRPNANLKGIADLSKHIDAWQGTDTHLKQVAKAAAHRTAETSAIQALRELRDAGIVAKDQVAAWDTIRNQVMHGSLISPYSSEEDDAILLNLAALLHALTRHLVSS